MAKKINISAKPTAEAFVSGRPLMKRLTIDIPEELHRRVKTACAAKGVQMADEIRTLLEKEFSGNQ